MNIYDKYFEICKEAGFNSSWYRQRGLESPQTKALKPLTTTVNAAANLAVDAKQKLEIGAHQALGFFDTNPIGKKIKAVGTALRPLIDPTS